MVQGHVDWLTRLLVKLHEYPQQASTIASLIEHIQKAVPTVRIRQLPARFESGAEDGAEMAAVLRHLPDQLSEPNQLVSLVQELLQYRDWDSCVVPLHYLAACNEVDHSVLSAAFVGALLDAVLSPNTAQHIRFQQESLSLISRRINALKPKQLHTVLEHCTSRLCPALIPAAVKLLLATALIPHASIQPAASQQPLISAVKSLFVKLFAMTEAQNKQQQQRPSTTTVWLENHLVCYTAFMFAALTDWPVYLIFDEQLNAKWMRYLERTPIEVAGVDDEEMERAFDVDGVSAQSMTAVSIADLNASPVKPASNKTAQHGDVQQRAITDVLARMESIVGDPQLLAQIKSDVGLARRMDLISSLWMKR